MKLSFVIPSYNGARFLTPGRFDCLLSSGEVVLVDDGSRDDTEEKIKAFPQIRYIRQENAGPAAARNTGWKAATGDIVCFLDSDTTVGDPDFGKKILSGFTSGDIAAVGGTYIINNPEKPLARIVHEEIVERHSRLPENPRFLGSYLLAVRKKVLEETDGFDESYSKASGEDNDLCYRIMDLGYKLKFIKDLSVGHYHTSSLFKYLKEQARHGYYRMKLYRSHPGKMSGDDYAGLLDFVQPPLAMLTLLMILLSAASIFLLPPFWSAVMWLATAGLVFMLGLLQIPFAIWITKRLDSPFYLLSAIVTFLRAYARGVGMSVGIIKFLFTKPVSRKK